MVDAIKKLIIPFEGNAAQLIKLIWWPEPGHDPADGFQIGAQFFEFKIERLWLVFFIQTIAPEITGDVSAVVIQPEDNVVGAQTIHPAVHVAADACDFVQVCGKKLIFSKMLIEIIQIAQAEAGAFFRRMSM